MTHEDTTGVSPDGFSRTDSSSTEESDGPGSRLGLTFTAIAIADEVVAEGPGHQEWLSIHDDVVVDLEDWR